MSYRIGTALVKLAQPLPVPVQLECEHGPCGFDIIPQGNHVAQLVTEESDAFPPAEKQFYRFHLDVRVPRDVLEHLAQKYPELVEISSPVPVSSLEGSMANA